VIYKARKTAEKKVPVVAKELLKVRLAICVKILMFISMIEK
jgi:hypothetical protein